MQVAAALGLSRRPKELTKRQACAAIGQSRLMQVWQEQGNEDSGFMKQVDGKTVGRHYAGPNWEHIDGSAVVGKVTGNAPGASAADIPWLKLAVASQRGSGVLTGVTTVQRINTKGGKLGGACDKAGTFSSAPYSADYVFLRKG